MPGQDASSVHLAADGSGEAVAVWTRALGNDTIAQPAIRPAGAAFAPVQDLSLAGSDAIDADVAIDRNGNAVAVWTRFNGSIQVQAAGRSRGVAFPPAAQAQNLAAGASAQHPDVAIDDQGRATVIWQHRRQGAQQAPAAVQGRSGCRGARDRAGVQRPRRPLPAQGEQDRGQHGRVPAPSQSSSNSCS